MSYGPLQPVTLPLGPVWQFGNISQVQIISACNLLCTRILLFYFTLVNCCLDKRHPIASVSCSATRAPIYLALLRDVHVMLVALFVLLKRYGWKYCSLICCKKKYYLFIEIVRLIRQTCEQGCILVYPMLHASITSLFNKYVLQW